MSSSGRLALITVLVAGWLVAGAARAIDWSAAGAENVVEILTDNEDGTPRETKIWLVVVDGQGYIRTSGTRWYGNVERDLEVVLRVAGAEHPLRAELVTDEALVEKVVTAFRVKYGFSDRMAGLIRFGDTHILRLVPR